MRILNFITLFLLLTIEAYPCSRVEKLVCTDGHCVKVVEEKIYDPQPLTGESLKVEQCYVQVKKNERIYLKIERANKYFAYAFKETSKKKKYLERVRIDLLSEKRFQKEYPGLKNYPCAHTPNLGNAEYMNSCTRGSSKFKRNFYCD